MLQLYMYETNSLFCTVGDNDTAFGDCLLCEGFNDNAVSQWPNRNFPMGFSNVMTLDFVKLCTNDSMHPFAGSTG